MKHLFRIAKWSLIGFLLLLLAVLAIFFLYCNSLDQVNPKTIGYYQQLKEELTRRGYKDKIVVLSAKRAHWHNQILTMYGASPKSRHLSGDAIDVLVMDINADGAMDSTDVNIAYEILDHKILKNKGGLGTYKTEPWFWNRQMIHLDSREKKSRWHR